MAGINFGDLARWTAGSRHTGALKSQLITLTDEMSSGVKSDLAKHLGFDRIRLSEIDRQITRIDAFNKSTANTATVLTTQQLALTSMEDMRVDLGNKALTSTVNPTPTGKAVIVQNARVNVSSIITALNSKASGQFVFSGNRPETAPLPSDQTVLNAVTAAVDFTRPASEVLDAISTFFESATGGLAPLYSGGDIAGTERQISEGVTIPIGTTATDPLITSILGATVALALAENMPSHEKAIELIGLAGMKLTTSSGIVAVKGKIGMNEGKLAVAAAENTARKTVMVIERNDRTLADPYETATRLKAVETQLESHYIMIGRMSQLSLVNYIR